MKRLLYWLFFSPSAPEDWRVRSIHHHLFKLEENVMALSAEVSALQTSVAGLTTSVDAAVAALGVSSMSAEDKAGIISATSDVSAAAQKLAAATPPAPTV